MQNTRSLHENGRDFVLVIQQPMRAVYADLQSRQRASTICSTDDSEHRSSYKICDYSLSLLYGPHRISNIHQVRLQPRSNCASPLEHVMIMIMPPSPLHPFHPSNPMGIQPRQWPHESLFGVTVDHYGQCRHVHRWLYGGMAIVTILFQYYN